MSGGRGLLRPHAPRTDKAVAALFVLAVVAGAVTFARREPARRPMLVAPVSLSFISPERWIFFNSGGSIDVAPEVWDGPLPNSISTRSPSESSGSARRQVGDFERFEAEVRQGLASAGMPSPLQYAIDTLYADCADELNIELARGAAPALPERVIVPPSEWLGPATTTIFVTFQSRPWLARETFRLEPDPPSRRSLGTDRLTGEDVTVLGASGRLAGAPWTPLALDGDALRVPDGHELQVKINFTAGRLLDYLGALPPGAVQSLRLEGHGPRPVRFRNAKALTRPEETGLGAIARLQSLRALYLEDVALRDGDLLYVIHLPALRVLSLRGAPGVTDRGVHVLASLRHLQLLDLRGTGVTRRGAMRLQRALPDCAILYSRVRLSAPPPLRMRYPWA